MNAAWQAGYAERAGLRVDAGQRRQRARHADTGPVQPTSRARRRETVAAAWYLRQLVPDLRAGWISGAGGDPTLVVSPRAVSDRTILLSPV